MSDIALAKKFVAKEQSAKARGISFSLSFKEFKRLSKIKYCQYTGIELTEAKPSGPTNTDRSLERIDNNKGYEDGNVLAVCVAANNLKAVWENPENPLTHKLVGKMIGKLNKIS